MDTRRVLLSLLLLIWWAVPVDAIAECTQDIYYVIVNPAHIKYDSECSSKSESLQMCAELASAHGYDPSVYCGIVYTDQNGAMAYGGWFMQQKDVTKVPFHFAESTYEVPRVKPYRNEGKPDCDEQCFGDPVNSGTGNKFEHRIEYKGQGTYPLEVSWTYNSQFVDYYHSPTTFIFGPNRTHFYGRSLTRLDSPSASIVFVSRPDGNAIRFEKMGNVWVGPAGHASTLFELPAGSPIRWEMINDDAEVERYDAAGRLLELGNRDGRIQRLAYLATGFLQTVESDDGRKLTFEYNASKLVSRINLPDGTNLGFRYSNQKYLSEVTYADGAAITYHYNEPGYVGSTAYPALTGIVDESGIRYSTTRYDNVNRALGTELGMGAAITLATYQKASPGAYMKTANVQLENGSTRAITHQVVAGMVLPETVTTSCAGCTTSTVRYFYDRSGHPDKVARNGVTTDYDYNAQGHLIRMAEGDAGNGPRRIVETDWDPLLPLPLERRNIDHTGAMLARQVWTYNTRGQVLTASSIEPGTGTTRTTTTTYCEQPEIAAGTCPLPGLVTSTDGPRTDVNDVTTYTYYPSDDPSCATSPTTCPHRKGDLWMVMDAVGHVTETLRYDGAGRVLSVKAPNGVVTDYEYHPRGWLTVRKVRGTDHTTEFDDRITRIDYLPTGLVQKVTLPDDSHTTYTYDAAHRLTDITDGEGNRLHYTLDNAGNRIKEDTHGHTGTVLRTLSRVYNQLGQLQIHKDAYAHATGYIYDANGNTDRITDALGRITDHDHDPLNRLSKTIQNVGGLDVTTRFQYDALDHLTEVTDPNGHTTKYTWNGLGDLIRLASPDTGVSTYTYDSAGNRKTQTDARGITATYGYDALSRLVSTTYPDSALDVTYQYDTAAPACSTGATFAAGRLSRITDHSGDTQYCYDRFGHLVRKVQTTAGQAHTVRYAYTKAGQLAAIEYPDGTVADYIRDTLGRTTEIGITRPGNPREILLTSAGYYPFGPAAEWVFGKTRLFQRTLNQNYQPGIVQDQNSGGLSLGYEFDPVGNLIRLRTGDQGEPPLRSYGYDALNRLIEARDGASDALLHAYTYDPTGNRASATEGGTTTPYTIAPYSHHLLAIGSEARTYDPNGNTTAIGTARTFVYNDSNRMAEAINNGQAATYAYNGKGEQVLRRSGGADTVFLHDEAGHWLGEYDSSGQPVQQVVWLDDLPVGLIVGPAAANEPLHYIEADALGTPRVVIESQRNVAVWEWRLTGEAFGKDDPIEDADGDGTSMTFNMRFPGQRYDPAMGLNYNYYRDYEAEKGRYAESDPIGLKGGYSTYAYATSTPLEVVDRSGLFGFDASCNAAQRAFITSQIVALANEINQRIQEQSVKCFTHDCDMKLIEDAMDFIARDAWYSCDGAEGGCGGQAARYQIFSPGYLSNPPEPESLTDPNKGCGCVRAALFHEAAHAVRPLHSESQIRRETRSCLTCAPNVDENGVPLW